MKTLNGKFYFDKNDINEFRKKAVFLVHNPTDEYDQMYSFDKDEIDTIIEGITAFNNSIAWEFSSETAINVEKIKMVHQTLTQYHTKKMTKDEFGKIPVDQVTSYCVKRYENWLKGIGQDLFLDIFVKYRG